MRIESYGYAFWSDSRDAALAVPKDTSLGSTAAEILEMVSCYASDGRIFYRNGDLVNATASFAYGRGWLDAGVLLGYVAGKPDGAPQETGDVLPPALLDHLTEKTHRYCRMLDDALSGVVVLPDTATSAYRAAQKIQTVSAAGLTEGRRLLDAGDLLNALLAFSYGYGWLDCGVRSGLFGITGDRHLFTI